MSQAPSPPSGPSVWRQIQERAEENPAATAIALYVIVAIVAILAAYFKIFSELIPYDDEGTVLVTLKAFVHGDPLYKEIWSVYGPFYYEVFGAFFKVTGASINTDASRTIVIVVWVTTSLIFGVTVQRLTNRLWLGLTGMIAAFAILNVLANEPMHPEGLCAFLLAALALLAVGGLGGRLAFSGAACGVVLAALVLTKVNLGVFAISGVVLAAALMIEPIGRRGWLRWLVVLAFLALPIFVLERDLNESWVRELALLEILAALSVLVASRTIWARRGEDDGGTLRWALAAIAGFAVTAVVVIVVIVATGPSFKDVYDGVVKEAFGIRNILIGIFPFPPGAALDWAIAAVAAAWLATKLRLLGRAGGPSLWPGLLRAAAGLLILLAVAQIVPFGINPSSGNPVVLPMLLAWVATIPPAGAVESPYMRLLRVMLPLVAIAESLQVYPVPGSQMGIAAVTFIPVGGLCLADALTDLRTWSAAKGATALQNFGATLGVLAVAVPAVFALNGLALPGLTNLRAYHDQPQLALPGADLMHLAPPQGEIYEGAVAMLHEHHCSTFLGSPSINSLYFWAGLESPRPQIPNGWYYALSESRQEQAVEELRASKRPCVLKNEELAPLYLHGAPLPSTPLVDYMEEDFRSAGTAAGSFQLFLPKPAATN